MQSRSARFVACVVAVFPLITAHVTHAQAPHSVQAHAQINPTMLEMARKKLSLEEQLANAQRTYRPAHPRYASLREQIADYNQIVTPQTYAVAVSERLQELQSQRLRVQLRLIQAQKVYAREAPPLTDVRQQLATIDKRIHVLQQQRSVTPSDTSAPARSKRRVSTKLHT